MNVKAVLVQAVKILILTIVMFTLYSNGFRELSSGSATMQQVNLEEAAARYLAVSLVDTMILTFFILRSRLSGLRLMVVVALVLYGVKTFTSMLEAWYFMPNIPPGELRNMFLSTVPTVLLFPPVAVLILGKARRQQEEGKSPNTRLMMSAGQLVAKGTFLSVVYLMLFWAFGYFVALRNPDVAAFYGVTVPDTFMVQLRGAWETDPFVFAFEFFRGALWIAMAAPVIRTTKGKAWEAGLIVALLFALVQNDVHLLPNPLMPPSVRLSHFVETASSNLIYAVILTWLMHRSHNSLRDLFGFGRKSRPTKPASAVSTATG